MTDQVLHLLVPGLLGPLPRAAEAAPADTPRTLELWLARGDSQTVPGDTDALLFSLFDVPLSSHDGRTALPTAPLCYLADAGEVPEGTVLHADPVHLRPDQDRLLLFDAPARDLTAAEAAVLIGRLNDHLAADGWRLSAPTPGRWYLHLDQPLALQTRSLGAVIGRNVDAFLPQGEGARQVRQCLNELQMLLHDAPVNAERVAAGRLPVNGVWLHGGGVLPAAPTRTYSVQGDTPPLLRGLLALADGPVVGQLGWYGDAQRAVWDADAAAWWRAVADVDRLLSELDGPAWLYPGDGHRYASGRARRWRLWRRRRPLTSRLLAQDAD